MKLRYFLSRFGYLVQFEQNPCGCHPFDVIITYSKDDFGKGKAVSVSFKNNHSIGAYIRRCKYQELT